MRVLVDTSVWSLSLRKQGPAEQPAVEKLVAMLRASVFRLIARHLEPFPLLDLERGDFISSATLHRKCAARGVAASTADCQIATAAMRHDCLLLSADPDFERIARLSRLKLA